MVTIIPPSIDRLRAEFSYNHGRLYRNSNNNRVGTFDKGCGYIRFKYLGRYYLLHRLIFYYHHGYMPKFVDHINRDKLDNRIENLRECPTKGHNTINSKPRSDNTSKYKGVTWHKNVGKWHCSVFKGGKRYYVGIFDTPEEAAIAYNTKAIELFGEFAYLNDIKENENSTQCP